MQRWLRATASLESVMAGEVARRHTHVELTRLHATLTTMRETEVDEDTFFRPQETRQINTYRLGEVEGNHAARTKPNR
jgi:hypothetical protein